MHGLAPESVAPGYLRGRIYLIFRLVDTVIGTSIEEVLFSLG